MITYRQIYTQEYICSDGYPLLVARVLFLEHPRNKVTLTMLTGYFFNKLKGQDGSQFTFIIAPGHPLTTLRSQITFDPSGPSMFNASELYLFINQLQWVLDIGVLQGDGGFLFLATKQEHLGEDSGCHHYPDANQDWYRLQRYRNAILLRCCTVPNSATARP